MNRQIRRFGVAVIFLYVVLFAQLNHLQVFGAKRLADNPRNTREVFKAYSRPRGAIASADGTVLALSVPDETATATGGRRRVYPMGELYAHVTGYFSVRYGATGVERVYNDRLAGLTPEQKFGSLADLFVDKDLSADVNLTIRNDLQTIARDELAGRRGSVVALDPRTGAILALYSNPTFDPNNLSDALATDPLKPTLARTYQENFFPGSTFKVVTATAGLSSGRITETAPVYPQRKDYAAPGTNVGLRNFSGELCGGTLPQILAVSCNTSFAQMAAETIGPDPMIATAQAFGFDDTVPIDLPAPAPSRYPTDFGKKLQTLSSWRKSNPAAPVPANEIEGLPPVYVYENTPKLAQTGIGQNDVRATPLQMAMVAAAVANGGRIMTPHVMADVRDRDGGIVERYSPSLWRTAMAPETATIMRNAMLGVVANGTATRLAVDGAEVGGKTGTAEVGLEPPTAHAWIIGFAGPPGQPPTVAVAVILENQPGVSESTGGRLAAPVAQKILAKALQPPDPPVVLLPPPTTTTAGPSPTTAPR